MPEDLFNLEAAQEKSGDFPDPIYVGKGRREDGRLIVQIKLNTEDIKLQDHIKDGKVGLKLVAKKQPDEYGNTHFLVVNQEEWAAIDEVSNQNLTRAYRDENSLTFSLSTSQLKKLMYAWKSFGVFAKVEILDNGSQVRVFKYTKALKDEAKTFLKSGESQKTVTPTNAVTAEEVSEDDLFHDIG